MREALKVSLSTWYMLETFIYHHSACMRLNSSLVMHQHKRPQCTEWDVKTNIRHTVFRLCQLTWIVNKDLIHEFRIFINQLLWIPYPSLVPNICSLLKAKELYSDCNAVNITIKHKSHSLTPSLSLVHTHTHTHTKTNQQTQILDLW